MIKSMDHQLTLWLPWANVLKAIPLYHYLSPNHVFFKAWGRVMYTEPSLIISVTNNLKTVSWIEQVHQSRMQKNSHKGDNKTGESYH